MERDKASIILQILATKEVVLNEVIVWLKKKKLWDECCRDLDMDDLWRPADTAIKELEKISIDRIKENENG